jgi:hypothetical protein
MNIFVTIISIKIQREILLMLAVWKLRNSIRLKALTVLRLVTTKSVMLRI